MHRIALAFRSFFALLFHGEFPPALLSDLGLVKRGPVAVVPPPAPAAKASDGALQILGILQRDSRLIDFMMEDIAPYSDEQVGAAVREMHDNCREALSRYVTLQPVIDGVEGTYAKAPDDPNAVKFMGNVPATPPAGGTLRHKGWRAMSVDLPKLAPKQDPAFIAPAEIEIE